MAPQVILKQVMQHVLDVFEDPPTDDAPVRCFAMSDVEEVALELGVSRARGCKRPAT